jgi:hypothetical protein
MTFSITFMLGKDHAPKAAQLDFFVKINYHMFPEMEDEFNPADYKEEIWT